MKKYLLQIIERNTDNPLQAGPVHSVEADSIVELVSKIPLLILEIQERLIKSELRRAIDDDIPF